jgi:hypothetical protein
VGKVGDGEWTGQRRVSMVDGVYYMYENRTMKSVDSVLSTGEKDEEE